jgi:hypothetical protein
VAKRGSDPEASACRVAPLPQHLLRPRSLMSTTHHAQQCNDRRRWTTLGSNFILAMPLTLMRGLVLVGGDQREASSTDRQTLDTGHLCTMARMTSSQTDHCPTPSGPCRLGLGLTRLNHDADHRGRSTASAATSSSANAVARAKSRRRSTASSRSLCPMVCARVSDCASALELLAALGSPPPPCVQNAIASCTT